MTLPIYERREILRLREDFAAGLDPVLGEGGLKPFASSPSTRNIMSAHGGLPPLPATPRPVQSVQEAVADWAGMKDERLEVNAARRAPDRFDLRRVKGAAAGQ